MSCGMRRFDKHKMTADKPVNQALHQENQQSLNRLIQLREEQDRGTFHAVSIPASIPSCSSAFTPWKTPIANQTLDTISIRNPSDGNQLSS
jgi:hypothetical protein